MKIGDIKIEALRLMYADVPARMTAENIEDHTADSDFEGYLAMMHGAINRCLNVIVERRVLPIKRHELNLAGAEKRGRTYRFNLSGVSDFYDVSRVIMVSENAYDGDYPYRMEGESLVLLSPDEAASFSLLYHPRLSYVEPNDNGELEGVPNEIAMLIPYYLKGEIYREDESGEASEAMSWFEQRLSEISEKRTEKQGSVACLYDQGVL